MHYLPSVMATAAMLHVVESIEPCLGVDFENQLFDILAVDKVEIFYLSYILHFIFKFDFILEMLIMYKQDQVEKLKLKLAMEGYGNKSNKRKFGSVPGSPNGVMDVSFSSDTSNDSWPVALSVSSSPEPLSKKSRAEDLLMQRQNHANVSPDFLTVPR